LFDINEVAAKNKLAVALLITVNSRANRPNVSPGGIFPSVTQKELVPDRVVVEPNVTVVERSQVSKNRVLVFVKQI
jgi:hypothetical protein